MTDVFEVAGWASARLDEGGFRHCLIGGIALQAWGEPRVTRDVDLSVLIVNRVLLCQSPSGIGIDIGLAGFPYEEAALERSVKHEFLPRQMIRIVGPEDLVTMKVFAGRPQDWIDVRGILVRQGNRLDWFLINSSLPPLLEALEEPERLDRLHALRDRVK